MPTTKPYPFTEAKDRLRKFYPDSVVMWEKQISARMLVVCFRDFNPDGSETGDVRMAQLFTRGDIIVFSEDN